jgi:hypothetical protein
VGGGVGEVTVMQVQAYEVAALVPWRVVPLCFVFTRCR